MPGKAMPSQIKHGQYLTIGSGVILFFLLLQIASFYWTPRYYFNISASEPLGLYRKIPFNGKLKRGELVLMKVPPGARAYVYGRKWLPPGCLLLKNVGALPGDEYRISDTTFEINQCYIGPISRFDSHRKPLPRLRGIFRVPNGYFLPVSQYIPNSFDGRYFGPVPYGLIQGKAVPVLILHKKY